MERKMNKPEIRFNEFNIENVSSWKHNKLGDLANIVRGSSPRPIQDKKWFDTSSSIGWLRIADVTEQNGRIYHLEQKLSELGQKKTRVLMEPHLLLSIAATVGKPVINYVKTGVHDGFLVFLNPKFDREYMFQWLGMYKPKWQKYGQPGSQVNLNSELVRNQKINIPDFDEQVKIGEFFKALDDTIKFHERKYYMTLTVKKAMLGKMFPQKDSCTPEIRFKEFTGEKGGKWYECNLGDVVEKQVKGKAQLEKLGVGNTEYLDTSRLNGGKALKTNANKDVEKDDILILWDGSKAGTVYTGFSGALGSTLKAYKTKANGQFIYQNLKMNQENIYNNYRTPNIPHVQKDFLDVFKIKVPSENEQIKIGEFFKSIDKTIFYQKEKLIQLKNIKNAMLQKMFV